jgi:uncharacterized protein (DUF3084 family)
MRGDLGIGSRKVIRVRSAFQSASESNSLPANSDNVVNQGSFSTDSERAAPGIKCTSSSREANLAVPSPS